MAGLLILTMCTAVQAQRGGKEKIRAYKTAYITQELNLSVEEAERFWPVYNEYDNKLFDIKVEQRHKERGEIKELGGPENLSDEQATKFVFNMLSLEKEAAHTREKMYKELSKVLSPKKLLTLYQAEMNFNKRLLSEFRKGKPD